jgi:lysocardiolipin and lysophospholipid acyltransferase
LDWLFLWNWFLRFGSLRNLKIVLKAPIGKVPVAGWFLQCAMHVLLHRDWSVDESNVRAMMKYYLESRADPQLLVFPEGTNLTDDTRVSSHAFATKMNLPKWQNVLLPKTTGFVYLFRHLTQSFPPNPLSPSSPPPLLMEGIEQVIDLTIGYGPNVVDDERDFAKGIWPEDVYVHCRRFNARDLVRLSDDQLGDWLRKRSVHAYRWRDRVIEGSRDGDRLYM